VTLGGPGRVAGRTFCGGMNIASPNAMTKRSQATSPFAQLYVDPLVVAIGARGRLLGGKMSIALPREQVLECFRVKGLRRGVGFLDAWGNVNLFMAGSSKTDEILRVVQGMGYPVGPDRFGLNKQISHG